MFFHLLMISETLVTTFVPSAKADLLRIVKGLPLVWHRICTLICVDEDV